MRQNICLIFCSISISSIHREPRKNITVFHQEILLQKKVRNWNIEGAGGGKGYAEAKTGGPPYR